MIPVLWFYSCGIQAAGISVGHAQNWGLWEPITEALVTETGNLMETQYMIAQYIRKFNWNWNALQELDISLLSKILMLNLSSKCFLLQRYSGGVRELTFSFFIFLNLAAVSVWIGKKKWLSDRYANPEFWRQNL